MCKFYTWCPSPTCRLLQPLHPETLLLHLLPSVSHKQDGRRTRRLLRDDAEVFFFTEGGNDAEPPQKSFFPERFCFPRFWFGRASRWSRRRGLFSEEKHLGAGELNQLKVFWASFETWMPAIWEKSFGPGWNCEQTFLPSNQIDRWLHPSLKGLHILKCDEDISCHY